ncbi:type II toxin-antitoxin system YafQ family toxin [Moraxella sp. ZY210820]|uniref:type II toxin-antitoxin system YafQ family toxin n=1 Tax=unclassified Moraxella TaxID=2685852 RepID=UPI002731B350|nr:type II toxin-antitoxin system YafQ family toxin [Moraxella sp. ZY210820]WLF84623.1 type II toxin-antitoxin system YafQ family toxin [Moraxella sp. ZY210820]
MRKIEYTTRFKRHFAKHNVLIAQWFEVIYLLINDQTLPERYRDHALQGDFLGYRDCHIKPDLVLIYRKLGDDILELADIGSHAKLFG